VSRTNRLILTLGVLGALSGGVGLIVGRPRVELEGAYFNHAIDAPVGDNVVSYDGPGLLDPSDGNLWLGGGIALVGAAAIGFAAVRASSSKP
jgi:hypothetical protein